MTQYSFNGSRVDLPDLNTGRYDHACSGYYNQQDQFVLLVVGGRTSPSGEGGSPLLIYLVINLDLDILSSTEVFEVGRSQWKTLTSFPLPSLWGLRAVTVDNKIYLTGDDSF